MSKLDTQGILLVAGLAGAGYLAWKLYNTAPGLLSGNNALTQNATDASGAKVTAYQDKGVVGTLGAAANKASGGFLASIGSWIGIKAYDLLHPGESGNNSPTGSDAPAQGGADTPAATSRWVTAGISTGDPMDNPSFSDVTGLPGFNL